MRSKLLLGTAVLLAGIGVAAAQNAPAGGDQGGRAGAGAQQSGRDKAEQGKTQRGGQTGPDRAQMQGKSEQPKSEQSGQGKSDQAQRGEQSDRKGSPEQKRGEMKGGQQGTVGQGPSQSPSEQKSGKSSDQKASKASDKKPDKSKAEAGPGMKDQTTGQAAPGKAEQKGAGKAGTPSEMSRDQQTKGQQTKDQSKDQTKDQTKDQAKGQTGATTSTEGRADSQSTSTTSTSTSNASVNLTTEQRTRIQQTVLSGRNVPRVDRVDFALSVGTAVPPRVRVVDVPPTLIEVHPEWRGHRYFVVRDEIIIVDRSRKVIATVPVGASGTSARRGTSSTAAMDLRPDEIREIQLVLIQRGLYHGEADGQFRPEFREALISFQRQQGIETVGEVDVRTVTALGLSDKVHVSGSSSTGTTTTTTGQGGANQSGKAMNGGTNRAGQTGKQPDQSTTGQAGKDQSRIGQAGKQSEPSKSGQADKQPQPSKSGQADKQPKPSTAGQAGKQPQQSAPGQAGHDAAAPKADQKDSTVGQGSSDRGGSDKTKRNDAASPPNSAGGNR